MNIREINRPVTAKALNESLAQRFGERIRLEDFTLEQLQDARNILRTKLSQVETNESFDSVHTSETYQKNRLFLDVLNSEISERTENVNEFSKDDEEEAEKDSKKVQKTGSHAKRSAVNTKEGKDQNKDGKKNFDDVKIARMVASGMSKEEAIKKVSGKKTESIVREGAEDAAELVMAAKDMVDRVTSWMEDTAEMQTESMLELADAIRDEMGQEQSDAFVGAVKPALEAMYGVMESTRTALTGGVGMLTGEAPPAEEMGAEEMPAGGEEMEPVDDAGVEDEFAASEPAVGGEEEAGRAQRESRERKRKMIESSRRLASILSKKK